MLYLYAGQQADILLLRLHAEHGDKLFNVYANPGIDLVDLHSAAFDARHVQHVVDNRQQKISRLLHPLHIAKQLFVLDFRLQHLGVAQQRVHRRADIMRHVRQEVGLGHAGALCLLQRLLELLLALAQSCGQSHSLSRRLALLMQQRQHKADDKHQKSNQRQHILLDKVLQRNLMHRLVIHRQIACHHRSRHSSQRFVQHGQQHGIAPVDSEGNIPRLAQKDAMQQFIIGIIRQHTVFCKKAVRLTFTQSLLRISTRSIFNKLPLRIVMGSIGLGKIIVLRHSKDVGCILIELLMRCNNRYGNLHNSVGKHKAILFCQIVVFIKMENHVDFAILQRLKHLRLRIEALHSKVQPLLSKAARRIEDIVRDSALMAAVLLIREEAAVSLQNADADFAMLRQPYLLILGKHRHGCRRHILFIQRLGIKGLVLLDSAHSLVQLGLEVRTVFVDRKIYIRAANRRNR